MVDVVRLTVITLLAVFLLPPARAGESAGRPDQAGQPNIVLILTDDQRWDSTWAMPNVRSEIAARGMTFTNAFVSNALCCPSRASILTATYSHTNGVYSNQAPNGGFDVFDDSATIATAMHDAGYRTALVGKYLNAYEDPDAAYIPPGWDRWFAFTSDQGNGDYFDWSVSDQGVLDQYGHEESDYSTDVLAREAEAFIRATPSGQPLFMYFSTRAPHTVAVPAPRHAGAFSDLPPWRPPSYNEADVSDKPAYIRALRRWNAEKRHREDASRVDQYRTLLAVDDAVDSIVATLSDTGRLDHTMIVFASDNGILWGEHRWDEKQVPYEESIRVPLVIRYDPLSPLASSDSHLVLNIDWAPTFADLGGATMRGAEGRSLMPILDGTVTNWRTDFLIEHLKTADKVTTYCAVRNEAYVLVGNGTDELELYDLAADPYQLTSVAHDPGYRDVVRDLTRRLESLCRPPPPGYQPP